MLARLYRRFPAVLMARRNLARTKVRTALAALGIVIGVVAIASLGMFGVTLKYQITQNLGDIGNQVVVSPATDEGVTELTRHDVKRITRIATDAEVVPAKQALKPVAFDDGDTATRRVVTGMAHPDRTYTARSGRIPDPFRSGALVGATLAEDHDLHAGSTIAVNGSTVRVRAVLESESGFGITSADNKLILPAQRFSQDGFSRVTVTTDSGPEANATAQAIRANLNDRRKRVTVRDLSTVVDQISSTFQALNMFLVGIGSISLVVAGVSILNVMLMSTVERREEIGVLRAVGFRKRDVLKVMLTEALLLGVAGGVVGVVLSVGAGVVINHFVVGDVMATFRSENLVYVVAAFAFALVTSVLSGLYPAWKAANERPVEALRG